MNNKTGKNEIRIGVVGAGSWGSALADLLASKGYRIDLWVFEEEVRDQILEHRENKVFLPGFLLSSNIFPTNDLSRVVSDKDLILIVVPSHVMRETAQKMADDVSSESTSEPGSLNTDFS